MKTLAIRSDFDFRFLGFWVLGFVVLESKKLYPYEGIWACQRICGIRCEQTGGLQRTSFAGFNHEINKHLTV